MRNPTMRAAIAALGALVVLAFLAVPSASAQEFNETREFIGTIEVERPDGCIDFVEQTLVTTLVADDEYQFTGDSQIEEVTTTECPPDDPAAEDEVLGEVIAFSGSNVDKPIAFGATMIGLGGLFLLAARKRDQADRDELQPQ